MFALALCPSVLRTEPPSCRNVARVSKAVERVVEMVSRVLQQRLVRVHRSHAAFGWSSRGLYMCLDQGCDISRDHIAPVLFHSQAFLLPPESANRVTGWQGGGRRDRTRCRGPVWAVWTAFSRHLLVTCAISVRNARSAVTLTPPRTPQRTPSLRLLLMKSPSHVVGGSFHARDASSSRHGCGGSSARTGPGRPRRRPQHQSHAGVWVVFGCTPLLPDRRQPRTLPSLAKPTQLT